jgi:hypothetical protein
MAGRSRRCSPSRAWSQLIAVRTSARRLWGQVLRLKLIHAKRGLRMHYRRYSQETGTSQTVVPFSDHPVDQSRRFRAKNRIISERRSHELYPVDNSPHLRCIESIQDFPIAVDKKPFGGAMRYMGSILLRPCRAFIPSKCRLDRLRDSAAISWMRIVHIASLLQCTHDSQSILVARAARFRSRTNRLLKLEAYYLRGRGAFSTKRTSFIR